jgi:TRAP-type uncharacterized transport system substrate-binding protein
MALSRRSLYLVNSWPIWLGGLVTVLVVAALATWLAVVSPAPPKTLVMATGPAGSTYERLGQQYRALLAKDGIDLQLRQTEGAIENLALLKRSGSGVSIAFVQGGLTSTEESPGLMSLGAMFFEPVWIFHRRFGEEPERIEDLWGRSLSIGPPGSGANSTGRRLVATMQLAQHQVRILELPHVAAKEALQRGELDAMLTVAAWEDPVVQELVQDPAIVTSQFERADAIVALSPFLSKVTVPRGVADLAQDLPPRDVALITTRGNLIVRADLHPALQFLLLGAATQIHSVPSIIGRETRFPAAEAVDLPLSDQAVQFYKSGRPFLQRYLPFALAVQIQRLLFLLIPLVGIVYPVIRLLPSLYDWLMRHRVYRLYRALKLLERDLAKSRTEERIQEVEERLEGVERRAHRMHLPAAFADRVYMLRMHLELVRDSIARKRAGLVLLRDTETRGPSPTSATPGA